MALVSCGKCGQKASRDSKTCPHCGDRDPFAHLRRYRKKAAEKPKVRRGLWLVLGVVGIAGMLMDPEPRPAPTPSVPLSTYQTIREFDDVTVISAEQYREMFRIYAQQCGTTEQDVVGAVQPAIDLYRAEGVRPEGRLAQYVGIAAQRLDERGGVSCQAFLGTTLMAGVVDAQAGR